MKNYEFSDSTKDIIGKRAGFCCSFKGCTEKGLVGPGDSKGGITLLGDCAHIFSSSGNGPRGHGNLTGEELKSFKNGIFLCKAHHKIIDTNPDKYSSEMLTRMRDEHEHNISVKMGNTMYPLQLIKSIIIKGNIVFQEGYEINLGKSTFIYGDNGIGKSTLLELVYSVFKKNIHDRWNKKGIEFNIEFIMLNPALPSFRVLIKDGIISYYFKKNILNTVPYNFSVFTFNKNENVNNIDNLKSDIDIFSNMLGIPNNNIKSFLENFSGNYGVITNLIQIDNSNKINNISVDINGFMQSFSSCSSTEKLRILLDFMIEYLKEESKFRPVILLIDEPFSSIGNEGMLDYFNLLSSDKIDFQVIYINYDKKNIENLDWKILNLI